MDLTRLRYFAAVAEAGSFSRAAAALHLTQPSLSRQVQLLEEELKQRLLERTGRGAVLTEAGTALLQHARANFDLAERARALAGDDRPSPAGGVPVGVRAVLPAVGRAEVDPAPAVVGVLPAHGDRAGEVLVEAGDGDGDEAARLVLARRRLAVAGTAPALGGLSR